MMDSNTADKSGDNNDVPKATSTPAPDNSQQPPVKSTSDIPAFSDIAVAGFLDNFKLELTNVSQEIKTLTSEQNKLLEKVGEHNATINSSPDLSQLMSVMEEMKGGMDRLNKLRHDMTVVHDRSEKLKHRAEKLESVCKNVQKKEEDLVAKMEKPTSSGKES